MEASLPQYAKVEQTFGAEPPIIHCPVCGEATMDDGYFAPCEHVSFVYMGATGDFEYQSDDFSRRRTEGDADDLSFDTFRDFLAKLGCDNKTLALEITYGGMACGPIWYTDVYGFSFASSDVE